MATTRLEKDGKLCLPRETLDIHHWKAGTEFIVEDRPDGLLLRPLNGELKPMKETATGHSSLGRDRTLADAMRDRYARFGH